MNLLNSIFQDFDFTTFPSDVCVVKSTKRYEIEAGVMLSGVDDVYLCVVIDKKWPDCLEILQLYPYTCRNDDEGIALGEPDVLFGWSSDDCEIMIDHHGSSVSCGLDSRYVVCWKKLNKKIVDMRDNYPNFLSEKKDVCRNSNLTCACAMCVGV